MSIGIEAYVGVGFSLDFSNGICIGAGFGVGLEFNVGFDWGELFE